LDVHSDPVGGLLACGVKVADTPGQAPITADFRLARGVVVTGKMIDRSTGKPVPGVVWIDVLDDNPFKKNYPNFDTWATKETAADGSFQAVTIPGPVILMGGPHSWKLPGGYAEGLKYKLPVADPNYPQVFSQRLDTLVYNGGKIVQGNFCKVLDAKPGTARITQDIILEQYPSRSVQIQDPEGHPLSGAWVTGLNPRDWNSPAQIEQTSCSVYEVEPGKPRLMVFYEPSRRVVGVLRVRAEERAPYVAKLGPLGSAHGRLLTEQGKPLDGEIVEINFTDRPAQEIHDVIHRTKQVVTDKDGNFRIDDLIPG
jgi:hypothetical protein